MGMYTIDEVKEIFTKAEDMLKEDGNEKAVEEMILEKFGTMERAQDVLKNVQEMEESGEAANDSSEVKEESTEEGTTVPE